MKNYWIFKQAAVYKAVCSFGILLLLFAACKKEHNEPVKDALKVTDYYPNSGNKGTLVTVEGTGLGGDVSATFSGTGADIVSATATAVVMRAPAGGTSGDIVLKVNGETVTVGKYTYQELTIKGISPKNGAAGTHVRISGEGFGSLSGPAQVLINGKTALVVSASDTLLVAEVPEAAGSGPVTVKVNGKEASGQTFKFQSITAIKPLTGGKGTHVRITGSGFDELVKGNYVDFNGKQALVEEAADDHLVVIAPDAVTTGPVAVTINNQKVTGPVFTVVALPVILKVTPLSGPAGAVMTITGTTFSTITEENKVTINGKDVVVTAATSTQITLTIPGGTGNGKIVLSVNDQLAEGPEFKDQSLGISKLSPESGLAGTRVTITGTGFNPAAGQNAVAFNGKAATVVSASETSLVVIAPEGFTSGPLKVVVNGQTTVAPADFNHAGVVTLAGGKGNNELTLDGRSGALAVDTHGNVYVLELSLNRVKKITPGGTVSLFAGSPSGQSGDRNGTDALFSFSSGTGMAIDDQDNLFVSDYGNQSIRKITPQGVVSTFVTNAGRPGKIAFDEKGFLYIINGFTNVLRFDKNGLRSTINPSGMNEGARPAIYGDIFYSVSNEIIYISSSEFLSKRNINWWVGTNYGYVDGVGSAAMFTDINGLTSDGKGNILVADNGNLAIRKISISTREVTTVAKFVTGSSDGSLNEAGFASIGDIAIGKDGTVYVLDYNNSAVRKIFLK